MSGTVIQRPTAAPVRAFELPKFDFDFASLTEGTDIPPPLPSPKEEVVPPVSAAPKTPIATPKRSDVSQDAQQSSLSGNSNNTQASPGSTVTEITSAGTKRTADEMPPASPTQSHRPSSIRRLFSRNLLNAAYASGEESVGSIARPESRSDGSFMDEKKAKRASWFRRLGNTGAEGNGTANHGGTTHGAANNKRVSIMPPAPEKPRKSVGPPPPMIPELSELKTKLDVHDEGSLGGDLFKDIN